METRAMLFVWASVAVASATGGMVSLDVSEADVCCVDFWDVNVTPNVELDNLT
jgi:hypothetical protein